MFINYMYNHSTIRKQIADVELLVLYSGAWDCLTICWQVGSGLFEILSTQSSFGNLRFNMWPARVDKA